MYFIFNALLIWNVLMLAILEPYLSVNAAKKYLKE